MSSARHRSLAGVLIALALLSASVAAASVSTAAAATPSIRLSPAKGAPGTRVTVSGSKFPANTSVVIAWDGSRAGMPAAKSAASGTFQVTFTVSSSALASNHSVKATAGRSSASASFVVTTTTPTPTTTQPAGSIWRPGPDTSWQIQFSGTPIDVSVAATMFDLDGFDTSAALVAQLHAAGHKVICYFSAGSWEDWRPDAGQFPTAVKGQSNGWPGEQWLDIRRIDVLGPIMDARMDMCKVKRFDGVDPDNVDGYTNDTGFSLTAADQLMYNRRLADGAHARGLSIGLKNDGDQASALVANFDFAIVEQCYFYDECDVWKTFVAAGRAVFVIEYSGSTGSFCPQANAANFNAMKKRMQLDAWRQPCR